ELRGGPSAPRGRGTGLGGCAGAGVGGGGRAGAGRGGGGGGGGGGGPLAVCRDSRLRSRVRPIHRPAVSGDDVVPVRRAPAERTRRGRAAPVSRRRPSLTGYRSQH